MSTAAWSSSGRLRGPRRAASTWLRSSGRNALRTETRCAARGTQLRAIPPGSLPPHGNRRRRGSLRPSCKRSPAQGIVEAINACCAGCSARGQTLISVARRRTAGQTDWPTGETGVSTIGGWNRRLRVSARPPLAGRIRGAGGTPYGQPIERLEQGTLISAPPPCFVLHHDCNRFSARLPSLRAQRKHTHIDSVNLLIPRRRNGKLQVRASLGRRAAP